ncbi:MAG: hypothetical protein QM708_01435 [Propioniciclava sp.]|uniref:HAAS signaling domain-containing protein n=1 Tax=Propioniciclava sp. TaxID=2038686 RepID=UPI0039E67F08
MTTLPRPAELYLDELAQLLAPAEPVDRIEIVAGIREHIEAQLADLPGPATDTDIATILRGLGSPDAVARQALPGDAVGFPSVIARGVLAPMVAVGSGSAPVLRRRWVPVVVTVLLVFCLAMNVALAPEMPAPGPAGMALNQAELSLLLVLLTSWAWIPVIILVWASPGWRVGWKVVGTTLPLWPWVVAWVGNVLFTAPVAGLLVGLVPAVLALVGLVRSFLRGRDRGE